MLSPFHAHEKRKNDILYSTTHRYFPIYHPPEIIRAIVAVSAIMGPRRKMCINPGYCF